MATEAVAQQARLLRLHFGEWDGFTCVAHLPIMTPGKAQGCTGWGWAGYGPGKFSRWSQPAWQLEWRGGGRTTEGNCAPLGR